MPTGMNASSTRCPTKVGSSSTNCGIVLPGSGVCAMRFEAKARESENKEPVVGSSCQRMTAPAPTAAPKARNCLRVAMVIALQSVLPGTGIALWLDRWFPRCRVGKVWSLTRCWPPAGPADRQEHERRERQSEELALEAIS